jgi:peptide/nickel transport system ATP-binding protein
MTPTDRSPQSRPLLSVSDLRVHFHTREGLSRAVDGVSYDVFENETVCIVGESGCGKTLSALTTLGLGPVPPGVIAGGSVRFRDLDLLELSDERLQRIRGRRIAMVFQEPMTALNPLFPISDQIAEAIAVHETVAPEPLRQRVIALLESVGIPDASERVDNYPHQLSGGQRQRVMIAMALACRPELIIADEPTTALDVTVQAQIIALMQALKQRHRTAIQYITHDLGVVSAIADRVYVMYAGVIVEQGGVDRLFHSPQHPYTRALLRALPTREKRGRRLYSIPGSVPHPAFKPPGCPFHPRCELAVEDCRRTFPPMCMFSDGHRARCPVTCGDRK